MRRLIIEGVGIGDIVELGAGDAHYLRDVVRARAGCELEILDGRGAVFRARLEGTVPASVTVLERLAGAGVPPLEAVTVAMAIVRGPRMDLAVEKLSELGIERLVPLVTSRSRDTAREARWARVAAAAARQCGRGSLLEVTEPCPLGELPSRVPAGSLGIILDPAGQAVSSTSFTGPHVVVVAGPEGGFTADEQQILRGFGYTPVRVARTVLRSETAAVVGAALVVALRLSSSNRHG